jgi:hypothetical protein
MTGSPREIVERWIDAASRQDYEALAECLHPEYIDEMPQSGERTRGVANEIAIMKNYPDAQRLPDLLGSPEFVGADAQWIMTPGFRVVRVEGDRSTYTVTAHARYPDGSHWHVIRIVRVKDGLIHRITSYYAPELPAPGWRAQWVERMDGLEGDFPSTKALPDETGD